MFRNLVTLSAALILSLFVASQTHAQSKDTEIKFDRATERQVIKAQEQIAKGQYNKGFKILEKLVDSDRLDARERAIIHIYQAATYFEIADDESAVEQFQLAYDSGGLGPQDAQNTLLDMARLKISVDQFASGAQDLELWAQNGGEVDEDIEELIRSSWIQAKNYDKALPLAEKYFNEANPKERDHYDQLYFVYAKLGLKDKTIAMLEEMLLQWPNDNILRDELELLKNPKNQNPN